MDRPAVQLLDPRSIDGLTRAAGARIETVEASFGDDRSTWHLALGDGRDVAARRIDGPGASAAAPRLATIANRLAEHGIPAAAPAAAYRIADGWWVLSPWIEGRSGRDAVDDPGSAIRLAQSMGALAARLREVPPRALGTAPDAVDPFPGDGLRRTLITRWRSALADIDQGLSDRAREIVRTRLAQLSRSADWEAVVVHGDFAPVNAVLDDAGRIVALIDLDRVGLGPADADVAWWGWVLRHHHPAAWEASMSSFLLAAQADDSSVARERRAALVLAALTLAVVRTSDERSRTAWLARLEAAVGWDGVVG